MATRRNPKLKGDDKAAITRAARERADEINELREQLKIAENALGDEAAEKIEKSRKMRDRRNAKARDRRALAAQGKREIGKRCLGLNLYGQPCQQYALVPEHWDGEEEISGDYCIHHDPAIVDQEKRIAFQRHGTTKRATYRRISPGEVAHDLMSRAPAHFLNPYLKALGLRMDPETLEIEKISRGLKLYGYSRGGQVIQSPYPDMVGQVQVVEKLLDRVYGKSRQAVDLASMISVNTIKIEMDDDRIDKVSQVLAEAGILLNGNGNGHHELPEAEVVEEDATTDE